MKEIICPRCNSENIVKKWKHHLRKPKFMCRDCRKQFVKNPAIRKIPLAGICRVTGVSGQWLQSYINEKY